MSDGAVLRSALDAKIQEWLNCPPKEGCECDACLVYEAKVQCARELSALLTPTRRTRRPRNAMTCPDDVLPTNPETPAHWAILGLALAIVAIDLILLLSGRNTLSQYVQHQSQKFKWLKWIGFTGLAVLAWHLFVGFPW